jgi:porin
MTARPSRTQDRITSAMTLAGDRHRTFPRRPRRTMSGARVRWMAALALADIVMAPAARSQATVVSAQHRDENGEALHRETAPVQWAMTYTSDANADIAGGERTGAAYLQRIGLIGDADLDRLTGWRGATAHVSVHAIQGNGLSASHVGNILTVSGIEAEPALRLFNLWIEQRLGDRMTLRVGQFTAGQEFAISQTANLFVNSTFGWLGSFATDLPSGGPAYPLAAPGLRLAAQAGDRTTIRAAIFSGHPAGQGGGDPQRRDRHGFNGLRLAGRPFLIGEVQRGAGGDDPSWSVTLGGWVHLDHFDDLAIDAAGASLASPLSSGQPRSRAGNVAAYAIIDRRLWRFGSRALHGFARLSASPADRNPIDLYGDGGLSMTSPLRTRPNDLLGIGFAVAHISPRLRSRFGTVAAPAGVRISTPSFEAVIETSYQLQLGRGFYVQPNLQIVVHPAGALLSSDEDLDALPRHAVVVGLRSALRL